MAEKMMDRDLLADALKPNNTWALYQNFFVDRINFLLPASRQIIVPTKNIPTVADVIGRTLPNIGKYNDLDNKQHVVALVDPDMCINCGKCYMTCNDSGYQVSFNLRI